MADTPDAPATDPWSMTPNEVAAKLAAMDAAIHPPPPLIPQDAQDARAQLDLLSRNASWAESLFKGNVETRKQFDELVAKAAGGDNVGDAVAGIVELTPPLFETTANGELPRRHVEGTIAGLRDAGLNDAAIEQAVNLPPISRAEFMAAQAFKARCHGSAEVPVIVARYKATSAPPALMATRQAKARCSRFPRTRSSTRAIPRHSRGTGRDCGQWTFHTAA
jgi:hypothetical protein